MPCSRHAPTAPLGLWVAALLVVAAVARADERRTGESPPPLPTDLGETDEGALSGDRTVDSRYRGLIAQALEEWDLGHWNEARARFVEAHELVPSARTLRAIGTASFEARQYLDAVIHLEAALGDPRRPLQPDQRIEALSVLERARGYLARFELNLPPHAEVSVDGHPAVVRAGVLLLDAGSHELVASLAGHKTETRRIEAIPGEEGRLNLQLAPSERRSPDAPETGATSDDPHAAPPVPPGASGDADGLVWTWVGAALTGALAVTTVGFHLAATDAADSVREECAREPCTDADVEALRDASNLGTWEDLRTVGLVSTLAALAGTGVALGLELSDDDEPHHARVRPWCTTASTGVQVSLSF